MAFDRLYRDGRELGEAGSGRFVLNEQARLFRAHAIGYLVKISWIRLKALSTAASHSGGSRLTSAKGCFT